MLAMATQVLRQDGSHAARAYRPRPAWPKHPPHVSHAPRAPWAVRGWIFDMGDVLYDATAWRRWLCALLNHLGVDHDYAQLFGTWDREYLDAVHRGEWDYQEAFIAFLAELGLTSADVDEV